MFSNRPGLFNNANTSFGTAGITFGGNAATRFGTAAGNTGFGNPASFGAQPASTGLFGATANQTPAAGGMFGGGTTTVFGQTQQQQPQQPAATFSFGGATGAATSTGQPAAGTGLFGGTSSAFGTSQSLFGGTQTGAFNATPAQGTGTGGGLFGSSTPGGGFLGTAAGGTAGSGTTVKFVPVSGTDVVMKGGSQQSVSTKLQCITGMKEYEAKSLEELRVEDYSANRKGPQQGGGTVGFSFGAAGVQQTQASGFGTFGQPNKPAAATFGGFGATATGTGLFGQQQQQQQSTGTGLFGNTAFGAAKPMFGAAQTTASTPFGGLSTAGAGTTLFGQASQNKGLFGATATTQPTNLFGTAAATPAFGAGTFGATGNTGFGANASAPATGLFAAKPTGFGTQTTGLFGQQSGTGSTGFSFTQTQPQSTLGGSLFGAKTTASTGFGGFGATGTTGFTGFGATPAASGFGTNFGLGAGGTAFGQAQCRPAASGTTPFNFGFGGTGGVTQTGVGGLGGLTGGLTGGQPSVDATAAAIAQQNQQQLLQLTSSPYGDSPLFRNLRQDAAKRDELLKPTNPAAQRAALANDTQLKVGGQSLTKLKPKPLHSLVTTGKGQLFDGLEEDESRFDSDSFVPKRSVRSLVIKSSKQNDSSHGRSPPSFLSADDVTGRNQQQLSSGRGVSGSIGTAESVGQHNNDRNDVERQCGDNSLHGSLDNTIGELNVRNRVGGGLHDEFPVRDSNDHSHDFIDYAREPLTRPPFVSGNESSSELDDQASSLSETDLPPHPAGIVLRRHGYFTLPALEEMIPDGDGRCMVENFVVAREGYGNVLFPGLTDVSGMNLDEIVHFRRKEIDVYPNDDGKPPVGEGLNKKAQVTLDFVWPRDKTTGRTIKDCERLKDIHYMEYLERASAKIGAKFIEYRPETGSWVFEVKHFSKYGLPDDSDDDDVDMLPKQPPVARQPLERLTQQQYAVTEAASQQTGEELQTAKTPDAASEVAIQRQHVGLGGYAPVSHPANEEDTEMPDITREKFPDVEAIAGPDDMEDSDNSSMDIVPSSLSIAKNLGVDAPHIQLQKASFFAADDDDDDDYFGYSKQKEWSTSAVSCQFQSGKRQSSLLFDVSSLPWSQHKSPGLFGAGDDSPVSKLVGRKETLSEFHSHVPKPKPSGLMEVEHMKIPSGLVDGKLSVQPVVGSRIQRSVIPLASSLLANRTSMIMDDGLVHSRRFRVGWAPNWVTATLARQTTCDKDTSSLMETGYSLLMDSRSAVNAKKLLSSTDFQVQIQPVTGFASASLEPHATIAADVLESRLRVALQNSRHSFESECLQFTPDNAQNLLLGYAEEARGENPSPDSSCVDAVTLWDLCNALWGSVMPDDDIASETSYVCQRARREAVSHWLTSCSASHISTEIQSANLKNEDGAAGVFSYLTGQLVEDACTHAIAHGDLHMALLISQAFGSEDIRHLMLKQLAVWSDTQLDQHVDEVRLCIYALLAGRLVWKTSDIFINTCRLLDWKRCFALHLWYYCSPSATISDAVAAYDQSYCGQSAYASCPLPHYVEKLAIDDLADGVQDVCYHLLKLYCDRSHPLHVLLSTAAVTDNPLDYSLSWHVMVTLSSLGYNHLSHVHHTAICMSYASQLESCGLWHWAIFVLLHLYDTRSRMDALRQTLCRHVTLKNSVESEKERFVVDQLHVPVDLVHEAKAIRAGAERNHVAEAYHLLKAKKWNRSHSVVMQHISSDAVVNDSCDALCATYLKPMADAEISAQIENWSIGGGLFLDYCNLLHSFAAYNEGHQRSDYELESLHSLATSVGSRLSKLICRKAIDSVCQSEMANTVAKVMTTLLSLRDERTEQQQQQYVGDAAEQVTRLPLPEDYTLEALGHVSHALLRSAATVR